MERELDATECMRMAEAMAKSTIKHIMEDCHEELTDIEIDKVLDAVRIIEICKRNGTK